jgi:hypothetical protein
MLAGGMATKLTAMRLPEDLLERIDRYVEKLNRAHPGLNINRTDAVRTLLTLGLDTTEGKPPKKSTK